MLEKLKAEVLLAYQELNKYGLNKYARGIVSAIDRESGLIVMKSDRAALVADMQGNIPECNLFLLIFNPICTIINLRNDRAAACASGIIWRNIDTKNASGEEKPETFIC